MGSRENTASDPPEYIRVAFVSISLSVILEQCRVWNADILLYIPPYVYILHNICILYSNSDVTVTHGPEYM